jgi:capsular polysaccharide biosynthesis protein
MIGRQELRKYFGMALRWLWLIVLCAVLGGGSAYWLASQADPIYRASATLVISQTASSDMSEYSSLLYSQRLVDTYSAMLLEYPVMEAVISRLELDESVEDLVDLIDVVPVPETQLIRLSVRHTDPALAAQIANAVADEFTAQNRTLQQARYQESLENMQKQIDELSMQIEESQRSIDALGTPADAQQQA